MRFYSLYKKLILLGIVYLIWSFSVQAQKITGGGFSYSCIDSYTYKVELDLYVDCFPPVYPLETLDNIRVYSESCGYDYTIALMQSTYSPINVSELCLDFVSTCQGGSYLGIEKYSFTDTLYLPEACSDWTISYQTLFRSADLNNIVVGGVPFYTDALINNTAGRCNNSPEMLSSYNPSYCLSAFEYQLEIFETDGDSISVTPIAPLIDEINTITYVDSSLDIDNPFYNVGDYNFDITNWVVSATPPLPPSPPGQQYAAMAILVEEFDDNGELIGSVIIDYQIVIGSCFNDHIDVVNLPTDIDICAGDSIGFEILLVDSYNDTDIGTSTDLIINTDMTAFPANANLTINTILDTTFLLLTWPTTVGQEGEYILELEVTDNSCPYPSNLDLSIPIEVYSAPYLEQDYYICGAGEIVDIFVEGGSNFTWGASPDITTLPSSPSGDHIQIMPSNYVAGANTTYSVTNECGAMSDVIINFEPAISYTMVPDQTVCEGESFELYVDDIPNPDDYTFEWTNSETLSDPSIPNPIAEPIEDLNTYEVTITSNITQCSVTESVTLELSGVFPNIDIVSDLSIICDNQSVQLNAVTQTDFCGVNDAACIGELITKSVGQVNSSLTGPHPFQGSESFTKYQFLIRADELTNAGIFAGKIEELGILVDISFTGNADAPRYYDGLTFKMSCTLFDQLNGFFDSGAMTTVVNPISNYQLGNHWNIFQLSTPFNWDGESNLLIEVEYQNPPGINVNDAIVLTSTSFNSTAYVTEVSEDDLYLLQKRPVLSFGVCETEQLNASYSWTPNASLDNSSIKNPIASPTSTTTYYVEVDNSGCINTDSITVEVLDLTLDIMPDTSICDFAPFNLRVEGGEAYPEIISYQWFPGNIPNSPNPEIIPLQPTTFHLLAITESGCLFEDSVRIDFDQHNLNLDIIPDTILCQGEGATLYAFGADSIVWSPTDFLSCTSCETPYVSPDYSVKYTVTAFDENGCVSVEKVSVDVAPIDLTLTGPKEALLNELVSVTAEGAYESITWTANIPLEQTTGSSVYFLVSEDVTLVATAYNELGCGITDTLFIKSIGCQRPVIANAFTPNNDGFNDLFGISRFSYEELVVFNIYDRWGKLVFTTTDINQKWDGTINGELAGMGVYVYYLQAVCEENNYSSKGNITLLR